MRGEGREIIMIGHQGHPEVEGTMGQAEGGCIWLRRDDVEQLSVADPDKLAMSPRRPCLLMILLKLLRL
jgi:4-hydroxy-3-methylbut-2-enyl diphosphate reductase